jgi:hypothetical protein
VRALRQDSYDPHQKLLSAPNLEYNLKAMTKHLMLTALFFLNALAYSAEMSDMSLISGPPGLENAITWDANAGKSISLPEKGDPLVVLSGTVNGPYTISYQGSPLVLVQNKFALTLTLSRDATEYQVPITIHGHGDNLYRLLSNWTNLSPETKPVEVPLSASTEALPPNWKQFEMHLIFFTDGLGGNLFTVGAGWAPKFYLSESWNWGFGLSFIPLKSSSPRFFPAIEYRLKLGYTVSENFDFEALAGAQTWFSVQAFIPTFGMNFVYRDKKLFPDWPLLKFGTELILGYSYIAHSSQAHVLRLGMGLSF